MSGRDFMHAFILGFEAESRVANAVYPAHYDVGWHITGTSGVFGAATAIGRLLELSVQEMIWAIGLAATQAAGLREMFGSMAKAFHPGRSAQNGYVVGAARQGRLHGGRARHRRPARIRGGPGGDLRPVEDHRRARHRLRPAREHLQALSVRHRESPDHRWRHSAARRASRSIPQSIAAVRLRVAPLVMDLCNQQNITVGLQGKFSVYHGAAIGLVRGKAGLQEYSDETVNDPQVKRVRELATAVGDPSITEDQARIEVELADGQKLEIFIEKSLGNLNRPMTDRQLDTKFRDQAVLAISAAAGRGAARSLLADRRGRRRERGRGGGGAAAGCV